MAIMGKSNGIRRYILQLFCFVAFNVYVELRIKYGISAEIQNTMNLDSGLDQKTKQYLINLPSSVESASEFQTSWSTAELPSASSCTEEELQIIQKQLPSDQCSNHPWLQRCSLTVATKCPDATWVDSYYKAMLDGRLSTKNKKDESSSSFVGIFVGCNKGFDAVKTLRMGTFNKKYTKKHWKDQMGEIYQSVCKQNESPEFDLSKQKTSSSSSRSGHVFCIEPMPQTVKRLSKSAQNLGWTDELIVSEAGIAKESGDAYFPYNNMAAGVENQGMGSCNIKDLNRNPDAFLKQCRKVPVYSLDDYARNITKKHVEKGGKEQLPQSSSLPVINFLSIDVEGYDFDVILGAAQTLKRTEYLEFEYNWMGMWAKQTLKDAVTLLFDAGFTCYFAGTDKLWRITDCFVEDLYSFRTWSNVACVNKKRVPEIAAEMESIFKRTLADKNFKPYTKKE